jgi:hypothetical protein
MAGLAGCSSSLPSLSVYAMTAHEHTHPRTTTCCARVVCTRACRLCTHASHTCAHTSVNFENTCMHVDAPLTPLALQHFALLKPLFPRSSNPSSHTQRRGDFAVDTHEHTHTHTHARARTHTHTHLRTCNMYVYTYALRPNSPTHTMYPKP